MQEDTKIKTTISMFKNSKGSIFQEELYHYLKNHIFWIPISQTDLLEKVSLAFLTDSGGDTFIPLCTDIKEFELLKQNSLSVLPKQCSIYDCAKIVRELIEVKGIVINPFSDNLVLNRENINYIIAHSMLRRGEEVIVGEPKEEYRIIKYRLKEFMETIPTIKKAYLLSVIRERKSKNLTLVIDGSDKDCKAIVDFFNTNPITEEIIDILKLQSEFSKNIIKEIAPFYVK